MDLTPTRKAQEKARDAVRAKRDEWRAVPDRLAKKYGDDWRAFPVELRLKKIDDDRTAILNSSRAIRNDALTRADELMNDHAAAELSGERWFQRARFVPPNPSVPEVAELLEAVTRLRWSVDLPRMTPAELVFHAKEAARGGTEADAALLTLIDRERKHSTRADLPTAIRADLFQVMQDFPLPQALVAQQKNLEAIAQTTDAINEAWFEMLKGPKDISDAVERNRPMSQAPNAEHPAAA